MKTQICVAAVFCGLLLGVPGSLAAETRTLAAGSSERKAVMDALRGPARQDLNQPVIFKVGQLKVAGDWAFARVVPLQPNGKPIDYSKTKYREVAEQGVFDAEGEALLKRTNGGWSVVEWRFGATDTEVDLWREKYQLPKGLFE